MDIRHLPDLDVMLVRIRPCNPRTRILQCGRRRQVHGQREHLARGREGAGAAPTGVEHDRHVDQRCQDVQQEDGGRDAAGGAGQRVAAALAEARNGDRGDVGSVLEKEGGQVGFLDVGFVIGVRTIVGR